MFKLPKPKLPKRRYWIYTKWYRPAKELREYLVKKGWLESGDEVGKHIDWCRAAYFTTVPLSLKEFAQLCLMIGWIESWEGQIEIEDKELRDRSWLGD